MIPELDFIAQVPLLLKGLTLLYATVFLLVLTVVCMLGPALLFALVTNYFLRFSILEMTLVWLGWSVVAILLLILWRRAIKREAQIVRAFGLERALWVDREPSGVFTEVVMDGWVSAFSAGTRVALSRISVPDSAQDVASVASVWWSRLILFAEEALVSPPVLVVLLAILRAVSRPGFITRPFRAVQWIVSKQFYLIGLIVLCDTTILIKVVGLMCGIGRLFLDAQFRGFVLWWLTNMVVRVTVIALDATEVSRKYTSVALGPTKGRKDFSAAFRAGLMRLSVVIADIGLPHYIRGSRPVTKQGLQDSLTLLKELGWPVNVELADPDLSNPTVAKYADWVFSGTNWAQGIRNMKVHTDVLLDRLRLHAIEYRRTESYGTIDNEIEATSRYFKSPRYDYPDLDINDVWFMVKDSFKHSRLTPFNYIIGAWEMKYGLGAFFRRPGSRSKLSRRSFVKSIGGLRPFKALWRKTFEFSNLVTAVSAVSIKGEALPPAKWMQNKVRSIIGTPLVHYIMTTIWNYEPNHRFSWIETPTKIGMPLNGYWLADLYHRHSRCQHHYAGDMSAFDSTISGRVIEVIKAVRKKGFEHHKDYNRICDLIDVAYEQAQHQLLNTTSNGNIYYKGTGLTTGHSSTSADNSLALLTLYMLAWKQLTGLGAREFRQFNELSDYGDDHVLSMLATRPAAWTFSNIQKVMASWGVTNRLEATGNLSAIPFLSKWSRKVTPADVAFFKEHGIGVPKRIVYHDRDKLIGKLVAKVKNMDPRYRAKRLLSYLSLTPHHPDVYKGIATVLTRSSTLKRAMRDMKMTVPTYAKVMSDWYRPSELVVVDIHDEAEEDIERRGHVFSYGSVSLTDSIVSVVAQLPDVLNPVLFNFGFERMLQIQCKRFLQWPRTFLFLQNEALTDGESAPLFRQTAYKCLEPTLFDNNAHEAPPSHYLLRHWLYCWYHAKLRPTMGPMLDRVTHTINQLQFIMTGIVYHKQSSFNFGSLDLAVIVLLNLVPATPIFAPIANIRLPRLDLMMELFASWVVTLIWTNVPPNYKEATHLLRQALTKNMSLLVQAPTGTGKSTAFVHHVDLVTRGHIRQIFVIVPRAILTTQLPQYTASCYNMDSTGWSSLTTRNPNARVTYLTPQEFVVNKAKILGCGNLVLVDECHIMEPFMLLAQKILSLADESYILMSATPTQQNLADADVVVDLKTAKLWQTSVTTHRMDAPNGRMFLSLYEQRVVELIQSGWHRSKWLVFHPSIEGGHALAERIQKRCSFVNSKEIDTSGDVIISTNVSDAGVTIPYVDRVITSNLDYYAVGFAGKPKLLRLNDQILQQRSGRTGRTNNGSVDIFIAQTSEGLESVEVIASDPGTRLGAWFQFGVSPDLVQSIEPGIIRSYFETMHGKLEVSDNTLVQCVGAYLDNLKYVRDLRLQATLPDPTDGEDRIIFDYTAAGTFSESSFRPSAVIHEDAANLAVVYAKYKSGQDFDTEKAKGWLESLSHQTALQVPFHTLFPWWEAGVDGPPDVLDEAKAMHAGALKTVKLG
jgi:hypothetical protein